MIHMIITKKTLPSLLAAAALACSTVSRERPAAHELLPIQVRRGSGTVYNLSKEEGERALHLLARTAKLEDYWIFTNNQWIDIGVNETPDGVNGDYELFKKFAKEFVTEYHVHPRDDRCIYPPSSKDVIKHSNLKLELRKQGISLESRLYDGEGEWTYTVSKDVETFLSLKNVKRHDKTFEELFRETVVAATVLLIDSENNPRDELIQRYIQKVSDFGVYLTYRKLR